MKKCPKCKAEIQENARFCLYCMTSFEEKQTMETPKENNKRWLIIIAAVLVVMLIIISIVLFAPKGNGSNDSNNNSNSSSIRSDFNPSADNNGTTSNEQQVDEGASGEEPSPSSSSQTQNPTKNENVTINNTSDNTTTNHTSTNSSSQNSSATNKPSDNTATSTSTPSTSTSANSTTNDVTSGTPTNTQPKYTYVTATIENAYPTGYSAMYALDNAIVITKANYTEESGNYVIPDTIDGKKVVAIMPSAFSDSSISSTVKSVTLPATVRIIWSDAFKDCFNLTDLYIKSAVIGIYEDALPDPSKRNGKLTIHCKKDCRDFDFYNYRNIVNRYDAEYEEWNG